MQSQSQHHVLIVCAVACGWLGACGSDSNSCPANPPSDAQTDAANGVDTSDGGEGSDGSPDSDSTGGFDGNEEAGRDGPPSVVDAPDVDAGVADNVSDADGESPDAAVDGGDGDDGSSCSRWSYWNDGLSGGRIDGIQFDRRTAGRAFAIPGNQLYRSLDAGETWTLVTQATNGIGQLAFPPGDPQVILAASSAGLQRSENGGLTWSIVTLSGVALSSIMVHSAEPRLMFVGGAGGILFRSRDGGTSWQPTTVGVPYGQVLSFAEDPNDASVVIANVIRTDQNGSWTGGAIIRTDDGGQTWKTALDLTGPAFQLSACPANPAILYSATATGLQRSTDFGKTWMVAAFDTQSVNVGVVSGSDCRTVHVNVGLEGVRRSTDGAQTWTTPLTSGMTLQPGAQFPEVLAIDPMNPVHVIAGTHGGLFTSQNGGDEWKEAKGIQSVLPRAIGVSPLDPAQLWMATWGSGLWHRRTGGGTWEKSSGLNRDWITAIYPDPVVTDRVLAGSVLGGTAWLSTNGGAMFASSVLPNDNPIVFATDPTDFTTIYLGAQLGGVYKSSNGGTSWTPPSQAIPEFVQALSIDPGSHNILYAATNAKGIYRSTDFGATWAQTGPELATSGIPCLLRAGPPPGALYACVEGEGIVRSTDGLTWTPANQGLASLDVTGLAYDATASQIYAVAGGDVYRSPDGTSWSLFDADCPPPGSGGNPTILGSGTSRYLVLTAATAGIVLHPL